MKRRTGTGKRRSLGFAALGTSGHSTTARDMEEILASECEPVVLPTYGRGGVASGVDLDDGAPLLELMEDADQPDAPRRAE